MKSRDFTLLWSASAASQLGAWCSMTANPLLALLLTHSPVFAGWVGAAGAAPLLMYLPAGWFVDRFDRRRLMFVGQTGRLVVLTLLVCALGFDWPVAVPLLIVTALCEGTFQVLFNTTEITAVQRVVDSEHRPVALARNGAGWNLALMTGRPLGGCLFGFNKALPYWASLLTAIWSIVALRKMNNREYQPREADNSSKEIPERPKVSILSAVGEMRRHPFLSTTIVVCAFGNFLFQITVLSLVVLAERQHMASATIGLLLATSGIGGLAGNMLAPKVVRRMPDGRSLIWFCASSWAALTLVAAIFGEPTIGLLLWGCLSVIGSFLNVALETYQTREVPEHMLGRVVGINRFVASGAVPLGALSAGYILAVLEPRHVARVVFALMLSMLLVLVLWLRPKERLTRQDSRPVAGAADSDGDDTPQPRHGDPRRDPEPVGAQ